jgi:hypothetical protein
MRTIFASWALALVACALLPPALNAQCTLGNATLHGIYIISGAGTVLGIGSLTAVGVHTWDGQGNTLATYTASVNGSIYPGITVTGSYSVNANCTASLTESDGSHYNFVVSPNGNTATWIQTDTGTVLSGTETRLRNREEAGMAAAVRLASTAQCPLGNATKHGTYLVSGTGTIVGVGPISAVGEITYDGQGNSIATVTLSVNGTIQSGVTVTGTYTVNSDCTGSHTESDGSHYDFVVTPDGNRASWIEVNSGTVVSGTEVRLPASRK